jgi:hypothetical protein
MVVGEPSENVTDSVGLDLAKLAALWTVDKDEFYPNPGWRRPRPTHTAPP